VGRYVESGIFCGQGVGRIDAVLSASKIIEQMIDTARDVLAHQLPARVNYD
jgi:NAD(P)H-dependent flavin oxidoreductase YrpB (nitropropane dioxygenase family)